jgi:hypothetical protein
MKYNILFQKRKKEFVAGFVLPYTLFIASIMIIITSSVSAIIIKQLYFSRLARQSKAAYYAADTALLCTSVIDSTYTNADGIGIFPYDATSVNYSSVGIDMDGVVSYTNSHRLSAGLLATDYKTITCAGANMLDPTYSLFNSPNVDFIRVVPAHDLLPATSEHGRTSTFRMKMPLGDGTFRCAKVTVNKTPTYRQIISQGYSDCSNSASAVERAVVDTTVIQ